MTPRITIAVDIGGKFTDLELRDALTGATYSLKSPTTPDDPARGLTNAIALAGTRFVFGVDDIAPILHGTTIATTEGFEDVLGCCLTNWNQSPNGRSRCLYFE